MREQSIANIWQRSAGFNAFRGCRCQAYMLTGDAAATDPVCSKSPMHERVVSIVRAADTRAKPSTRWKPILFRTDANSRVLIEAAALKTP